MITGIIIIFTLTIVMMRVSAYFFVKVKEEKNEKMTRARKDFYRLIAILVWPWYVISTFKQIKEKACNDSAVSLLLAFTAYWASLISTLLFTINLPPHKTIIIGGGIFIVWAGIGYLLQTAVDYHRLWYIID